MRRDLPSNLANKLRRHVIPNKLSLVLLDTNKCYLMKMMTKAKVITKIRKDASKVKSGRAVVLGTETLIGSVATLFSSVQR